MSISGLVGNLDNDSHISHAVRLNTLRMKSCTWSSTPRGFVFFKDASVENDSLCQGCMRPDQESLNLMKAMFHKLEMFGNQDGARRAITLYTIFIHDIFIHDIYIYIHIYIYTYIYIYIHIYIYIYIYIYIIYIYTYIYIYNIYIYIYIYLPDSSAFVFEAFPCSRDPRQVQAILAMFNLHFVVAPYRLHPTARFVVAAASYLS